MPPIGLGRTLNDMHEWCGSSFESNDWGCIGASSFYFARQRPGRGFQGASGCEDVRKR